MRCRSSTCWRCWSSGWRSTAWSRSSRCSRTTSPADGARAQPTPKETIMPSAYVIVNVRVTDSGRYADYKNFSPQAMQAHGAEVCVRGGAVQVLEGDWQPDRLVVLKFASVEQAKRFYDSAEYRRARQAR